MEGVNREKWWIYESRPPESQDQQAAEAAKLAEERRLQLQSRRLARHRQLQMEADAAARQRWPGQPLRCQDPLEVCYSML